MPPDRLLTAAQAATLLGVRVRWVQTLCAAGRLPAMKHGRDWLIREEDLRLLERAEKGWPKGCQRAKERPPSP